MHIFVPLFAMTLFSASVMSADFQLPNYMLGVEKSTLTPEVLAQTKVSLFELDAAVSALWADNKLKSVELSFYQGKDYTALKQKTTQLLQQLTAKFGAVVLVLPNAELTSGITLEQQLEVLDQVMQTSAAKAAGYRQSHQANSIFVLDFQPASQPDNCRLHLAVTYSSVSDEYHLELFIDEKTAESRVAGSVINLEAL